MTFDMFRSTDGGLHYPVHMHDYHQTTDSAGNIHLAMRLVVAECLMVVEATYHPLGGNPVFP